MSSIELTFGWFSKIGNNHFIVIKMLVQMRWHVNIWIINKLLHAHRDISRPKTVKVNCERISKYCSIIYYYFSCVWCVDRYLLETFVNRSKNMSFHLNRSIALFFILPLFCCTCFSGPNLPKIQIASMQNSTRMLEFVLFDTAAFQWFVFIFIFLSDMLTSFKYECVQCQIQFTIHIFLFGRHYNRWQFWLEISHSPSRMMTFQ